jgi:hypothetical protein
MRRSRWNPDAPANQEAVDCITRLLNDRVLTGTRYDGHTVAPAGLTALQANQAISALTRLPYPDSGCRGGKCEGLSQCSRHSSEYQSKYGRAYNE